MSKKNAARKWARKQDTRAKRFEQFSPLVEQYGPRKKMKPVAGSKKKEKA